MTIDEAIDSEKRIQKIRELEDKVTGIKSTNPEYHKQIAEWLEELKEYRKGFTEARNTDYETAYVQGTKDGYNKGIDDFMNKLLEFSTPTNSGLQRVVNILSGDVKLIAEELKGGNNDN